MNVEFANPFLESIQNVLSTMAMLDARAGAPAIKTDNRAEGDVTGIIGMASEKAQGTLAISFSKEVLSEISKRMLSEDFAEIDDSVVDMVGELTNMTTGGAKKILSTKGYHFDMAIPSMITGKDHVIHHGSDAPVIMVPFSSEAGDFFVELCFVDRG